MRIKIVTYMSFLLASAGLSAQQSINTSGGDGSGAGGSVSLSIGQVNYTAAYSVIDESSVLQGVQIPAELYQVNSCDLDKLCTDLDVLEIGFGTANARVNATWTNPNGTTDCEVRGGRIAPSSIGTGTPLFANINNTRVITQTNGSTVLFNVVLYNNPNVPFVIGQTYGYEVRCLCEDGSEYTNWSGMTPESTFIVPSPPASNLEEGAGDEAKWLNDIDLSIFPNPNGGEELMVVLSGLSEEEGTVQLELLDMMGRLIQSERISAKGGQVSYRMYFEERLPSGLYLIRASQEGVVMTRRLVIE